LPERCNKKGAVIGLPLSAAEKYRVFTVITGHPLVAALFLVAITAIGWLYALSFSPGGTPCSSCAPNPC